MKKRYENLDKKLHTRPGSLLYTGTSKDELNIRLTQYSEDSFKRLELDCLSDCLPDLTSDRVTWLHITGLNDIQALVDLAESLDIHPLVMEDILDITNDSKVEDYGDYLFVIAKNIFFNKDREVKTDQISFILYDNLLISFEEKESPIFDNVYRRIQEATSIRKFDTDYLLYSLLDAVVDNYFFLIGHLGTAIDELEDKLLVSPDRELLDDIYRVKKDIIYIRNVIWPMRTLVNEITKTPHPLIDESTIYYFRDIYDNIVQIVDLIETSREISSGMLQTYLSSVGNKTNDIMKVLTIVSTISIPLTFLTGVFGMNFKYFPSLNWRYAYPAFWAASILLTLGMIKYFQKKDWM